MALAFNAATDGGNNGGSTNSRTFSHTCSSGSNRLLIVAFAGDVGGGFDDVTGVTYNGVAMTLAVKKVNGANQDRQLYLYYLLNPASGANNVVISCTNNHYIIAGASDYTGALQSGQPDATTTNLSAANAASLATSITTVADNAWAILVAEITDGGAIPGASTGDVRRTGDAAFGVWGIFDSNGPIHPAGSYSMTTTQNTGFGKAIAHVVASFAPDTGGAAAVTLPQLERMTRGLERGMNYGIH